MQTTQGNSRAFQRVMKAMLELHRFFRIGFLDYVNNASHLDLNLPELQNAYTIILDEQFELRPDVFTVAKDA
ncbi:MAG: hypothetical protein KDJ52_35750, partial [Anaerolineae bacterium]|nr:hypothetical protein [Anaerolineae bacterium]